MVSADSLWHLVSKLYRGQELNNILWTEAKKKKKCVMYYMEHILALFPGTDSDVEKELEGPMDMK